MKNDLRNKYCKYKPRGKRDVSWSRAGWKTEYETGDSPIS